MGKSFKSRKDRLIWVLVFAGILGILSCGSVVPGTDSSEKPGGPGNSPPAPLPSPISKLISVSNPTAFGQVLVSGAPQSVGPGARVTIFNGTPIGIVQKIWDWIYRPAMAGGTLSSNTTLADSEGAFQLSMDAKVGDVLVIIQSIDNNDSTPTEKTVEGNTIRFFLHPQGLALIKPGVLAVTGIGEEGIPSEYYTLDFMGPIPPFSLPDPELILKECDGVEDLVVDSEDNNATAICLQSEKIINFPVEGSAPPNLHPVQGIMAIAGLLPIDQGVLGLGGRDVPLWAYNTATGELDCPIKFDHPGGPGISHIQTTHVDSLEYSDGKIASVILAVSQFADESWVLSRILFEDCSNTTVLNQAILPPGFEPSGLAGRDMGAEALVTDGGDKDLTYWIRFDKEKTLTETIPVGNNPQDVIWLDEEPVAIVVNQGDNSLTRINFPDLSTQTLEGAGLSPTKIVLVQSPKQAAIISSFDRSVVLIDLDF